MHLDLGEERGNSAVAELFHAVKFPVTGRAILIWSSAVN
jgi:hypothetical protein